MSNPSKSDWKARIEPHLSTSLQTVSDKITQTEAVQSWLHTASMEAAEGLEHTSGMQGEMMGYMWMMDDLEAELPELLAAVDELTEGCGEVDLHWRPLQPNFSRLKITFDRDYTVTLFVRLEECTRKAARGAVRSTAEALPGGEPFPNRPNTVTGLVARDGRGIGIHVKEFLGEDRGTYRLVTLRPPGEPPIENRSQEEAAQDLVRLLCSTEG